MKIILIQFQGLSHPVRLMKLRSLTWWWWIC